MRIRTHTSVANFAEIARTAESRVSRCSVVGCSSSSSCRVKLTEFKISRNSRTKHSCSCRISSAFRPISSSSLSVKRYRILGLGTSFTVDADIVAVDPSVVAEVAREAAWRCVYDETQGPDVKDAEARPKVELKVGVRVARVGKLRR